MLRRFQDRFGCIVPERDAWIPQAPPAALDAEGDFYVLGE
jgi:hypothetical protein